MRVAVGIAGGGIGFALGGPVGLRWGYAAGSILGSLLFPPSSPSAKTPRITPSQMQIPTAQYGISVPLIYGTRGDVTGNVIWYDNWQSHEVTEETEGGGGIGKGGGSQETVVGFTYSVSFAICLCMSESPRKVIIRAWRNKEEMSLTEFRQYDGSQLAADPHLASFVPRAPVYKNLLYCVFQDFDLGSQTSLPRLSFEISDVPACPSVSATSFVSGNGGYERGDLIYHDGYLFKGTDDAPGKIEKVNTADMSLDSTLVLGETLKIEASVKKLGRVGEEKLWATTFWEGVLGDYSKLYCIDLETFTIEKQRMVGSVVSHGGKRWICGKDHVGITPPGGFFDWEELGAGIVHDDIEDWSSTKQYFRCVGETTAFTYSPRTDMMYWITDDGGNNSQIVEVDPFSITALRKKTISTAVVIYEVKADNNYLYVASPKGGASTVIQINPVDMVEKARFNTTTNELWMELIEGFLYILGFSGEILWKVDPADMTEVTSVTPPSTNNPKDIVAGWGGVIVIGDKSVHRFALDDLELICSTTYETEGSSAGYGAYDRQGAYGDLFVARGAGIGEIYRIESPAGNDVTPPDISEDLLTSSLYGVGLDSGVLNAGEFNISRTYCYNNDLLVSMLFNTQTSVLDVLGYIAQHHNGYYRYYDGKIGHMQLQSTDVSVANVTDLELVKERRGLPVQGLKPEARGLFNEINVEYVKRRDQYVPGIAPAHDMLDRDKYGLKVETVRLDGFCTFERAAKMADLLLRKSLINARAYTFKLGPKSMPRKVGEIITLDYPEIEASDQDLRITSIGEGENGVLQMTTIEEVPEIYQFRGSGIDSSVPGDTPTIFGHAPSVINPMAVELPALYSGPDSIVAITYEKPMSDAWAGATLFRSFNGIDGFQFIKSIQKSGLTGRVTAVGIDASEERFVEVRLDGDDTLFSAVDSDSLMQTPRQNLSVFETSGGDIFVRFQTATLQSARVWRLTGLIYNTVGFGMLNDYGIIRVHDKFATQQQIPFLYNVPEIEKHRSLFFKLASFNHRGEGQLLSEGVAFNQYVDALSDKPLVPFNVKVNGIALDDTLTIKVPNGGGDVELEWKSRNRFNTGGYNYNRADAIPEDSDFVNFEMEVYRLTELKRTITQTGKTFTYTAAMQSTDVANTTMNFKLKQNGGSHTSSWLEFSLVFA